MKCKKCDYIEFKLILRHVLAKNECLISTDFFGVFIQLLLFPEKSVTTLSEYKGPNETIRDYKGHCRTIRDNTEPYKTIQGPMGPNRTIGDQTEP